MVSDLQRVARGLVECLDEVPQVISHLQRTADRCRENAALAIAASHGHATVAAQQLDAAARACEAAAHYLSMAPPKARAWAERLVGDSRRTDRPSADSADRNKATGGTGDLAERDSKGRTKRLTTTFEDLEVAEDNEPPLITVARKAFEKFRKAHEKDDEHDRDQEPLEVEIVVTETGEIVVQEEDDKERKEREAREDRLTQDYEIEVDLTEAAKQLLAAMSESTEQTWERANLTITPTNVEATFDYPDDPQPIIVDINLPDLGQPDFDPAFDLRPLGSDFTPGVHDPHSSFDPREHAIADRLAEAGWRIDARVPDHTSGDKNPDAMVRKSAAERGVIVEFKTPTSRSNNTIKRNIGDAGEQAKEVVIDCRKLGVTEADAWRAYRRAVGQPGKTIADVVHVILGDGRLVTYRKEQ
ncbi:hypothetical protein EV646_11640 [Kribbella antiqua]|uniref:tRNA nuclease CdiA C-terminal domain-containing protein n=1 Tax=Kribbella antiqua TaxID=2512217 RepID=A0A4R2IB71_9ACTN|nr:hypothetical protein [Kribbella antiqua]TCO40949.1 hypothetical protein EV646_11640 [Kribbella antiqua]